MDVLQSQVGRLVVPGRSVLALDTAPPALAARFRAAALVPSEPVVRAYHAMVLGAPGLAAKVSGLVLRAESFRTGSPQVTAAQRAGIVCGVRADTGQEPLAASGGTAVTTGLDGLGARLSAAREHGARFAVWSVCSSMRPDTSAWTAVTVNSQAAARFAHTCTSTGLVPLVRIGFRTDDAPGERRRVLLAAAVLSLCGHLEDLDVDPAHTVVCLPGADVRDGRQIDDGPLAAVPPRLGAVLVTPAPHGDLGREAADTGRTAPWPVGTCVGRAVTGPALVTWRGRPSAVAAARRTLRECLDRATGRAHPLVEVVPP